VFDYTGSGIVVKTRIATDLAEGGTGGLISSRLLQHNVANTSPVTSAGSWALDGTWTSDTTNPYRGRPNSIRTAVTGGYIQQAFSGAPADGVAYLPYCIAFPETGFEGSIRFDWGSENGSVAHGAMTINAWNAIVAPVASADTARLIYSTFFDSTSSANARLRVTVVRTAGAMKLALAGLLAMQVVDGVPTAAIGTAFVELDAAGHWTDTQASADEGWITDLLARRFGVHLPVIGSNNIDTVSPVTP
jgi:hypothetical protein